VDSEKWLCFSEGASYSVKQYVNIVNAISADTAVITVRNNSFSWNITGFSVIDETPVIVFPKNYTLPEDEDTFKQEAIILLKTLIRYRNERDIEAEEKELLYGRSINNSNRIAAAVYIIEDYMQSGLIKRKRTVISQNVPGRIHWGRTISKTMPLFNGGEVIYSSPVMISSTYDSMNLLRNLHEYIVYDCARLWGWLLDFEDPGFEITEMPCPFEEAIDLLKEELTSTFVQREISLISTMIEYLEALRGIRDSQQVEFLSTPYFHWIWEAICGYVFDNDYNRLKQYVPSPEWHSDAFSAGIEQRPDILFYSGNTFYILDAKYYNYHKNVPGWHDVVKQYFYRLTIMQALNKKKSSELAGISNVENVFVFPGDKGSGTKYLGYVDVSDVAELGNVKAYIIDSKVAMKAYAYQEDSKFKDELMKELRRIM